MQRGEVMLVEVGPRDGLQNEPSSISAFEKVKFIDLLSASGLRRIEAGSFVSTDRVPQMASSDEIFGAIRRYPGASYSALVPNLTGLERAARSEVDQVAVFISASESFSLANLNCSIAGSLERAGDVIAAATLLGIQVRGYISCAIDCPFEGAISAAKVQELGTELRRLGCFEISLADTIGTGAPLAVERLLGTVGRSVPVENIAVHFHDTYGQALANILRSIQCGVRTIDASVSGLGGCPFAPGATGNVATEDVLFMLNGMNFDTGVDIARLAEAGDFISQVLGRRNNSKYSAATHSRRVKG